MALLLVLVILVVLAGSSALFIWFMNQQQTRAGVALRSAAAMSAAEAGVHRVLSILETVAPDGSAGRAWRPQQYSESLTVGSFESWYTVSLVDDADGAIIITSTGQVADITRRLRARAYLASPALLAALYGTSLVRVEDLPASLVIIPYGASRSERPWVHIAAGRGVGLASTRTAINDPATPLEVGPGPMDSPEGAGAGTRLSPPGPVRLLLTGGAELTVGPEYERVDAQQLRAVGIRIEDILRIESLPALPEPDRAYLQARSRLNTTNADVNAAAGKYTGNKDLALKRDSLYSPDQFDRLQLYLQSGLQPPRLEGVVFVKGDVTVPDGQALVIAGGALITEGMLRIGQDASLEVIHSASTRTLPGIMVLDGALLLTRRARLRAHGLVYAGRIVDLWAGSHLDVVGAVAGGDRAMSFRNIAGTALIRYDPAVLGTPGLRLTDGTPPVAWVAAWEELP